MNNISCKKSELRSELRKKRASVENREEKSASACQSVKLVPGWKTAENVLVYVSFRSEVSTEKLLDELFSDPQKHCIVPLCLPEGGLKLLEIRSRSELEPGAYGILEPNSAVREASERLREPEMIDFAVLPGVGFDLFGHRLGQGGGYYDRLLPRFRPEVSTVGLAFECQILPEIPTEAHDLNVKYVASETLVVATRSRALREAKKPDGPQVWGILGGIACGKSVVSRFFREKGIPVFDADQAGHTLYERADIQKVLIGRWGKRILNSQGLFDRKKIAKIVFETPSELVFLNSIFHPAIREDWHKFYEKVKADEAKMVILDAPVLLESGWGEECGELLFIDLPRELQLRFVQARGWTQEQLEARERNQFSLEVKRTAASVLVPNSGGEELWNRLKNCHLFWTFPTETEN